MVMDAVKEDESERGLLVRRGERDIHVMDGAVFDPCGFGRLRGCLLILDKISAKE